jgi:Zn-dependent protease with chaperone function
MAGFLRDLVAWNPIAHLSLRRLLSDREVEADRRAAALTGNPLAVASGLVRLCEMKRGRRGRKHAFAVAFGGGRVTRRVTHLLALADGRTRVPTVGTAPYIAAALLVAVVGLQAGAKIAAQGPGAYAITLGSVEQPTARMWTPPAKSAATKAAHRRYRIESKVQQGLLKAASGVSLRAKFKGEFTRRIQRVAHRAGLIHQIQVWDLYRLEAFSGISIYRLAPGPI